MTGLVLALALAVGTALAAGPQAGLSTADGRPVTPQSLSGQVSIIGFGYTACPDICPLTLANMAQALSALGADAARVQALFLTLDPARDDWSRLTAYVRHFHADVMAVRGPQAATRRFAEAFDVRYSVRAGGSANSYLVDHSTEIVVTDAAGRVRAMLPFGLPSSHLVEVVSALIEEPAQSAR